MNADGLRICHDIEKYKHLLQNDPNNPSANEEYNNNNNYDQNDNLNIDHLMELRAGLEKEIESPS